MSLIAIAAQTAQAAGPDCGAVIVKTTTLRSDLKNCSGNGLMIGADNLMLDLGGHTIDGTGTHTNAGILLLFEHHGVIIKRGIVTGFETGVGLGRSDHNRLDSSSSLPAAP